MENKLTLFSKIAFLLSFAAASLYLITIKIKRSLPKGGAKSITHD